METALFEIHANRSQPVGPALSAASRSLWRRPRINYGNLEIHKMPYVSCRECGSPRQHDTSDLGISHIHGSPSFLSCRCQGGGCSCRCAVEIQYPVIEVL